MSMSKSKYQVWRKHLAKTHSVSCKYKWICFSCSELRRNALIPTEPWFSCHKTKHLFTSKVSQNFFPTKLSPTVQNIRAEVPNDRYGIGHFKSLYLKVAILVLSCATIPINKVCCIDVKKKTTSILLLNIVFPHLSRCCTITTDHTWSQLVRIIELLLHVKSFPKPDPPENVNRLPVINFPRFPEGFPWLRLASSN